MKNQQQAGRENLLHLAAAPDDQQLSEKAVAALREQGKVILDCLNSLDDVLEEPFKGKFLDVKGRINTVLASLPISDAVPAASRANDVLRQLMDLLAASQMMIGNLQEFAKSAGGRAQLALNSIPTEIKKALDSQVASGELVTKADHAAKVAEAAKQAREQVTADFRRASERRLALHSANLEAPAEEALMGSDEEFAKRKTRAETRITELAPYKLKGDRLILLAWNLDDEAYKAQLETLKAVGAATEKDKAKGPIPFVIARGKSNLAGIGAM